MTDLSVIDALEAGVHHDPFAVLGPHVEQDGCLRIQAWLPGAHRVFLLLQSDGQQIELEQAGGRGLFRIELSGQNSVPDYRYKVMWEQDTEIIDDPYRFGSTINPADLEGFSSGTHERPYRFLGAHQQMVGDTSGVRFAVWAPGARSVLVVGDFNLWSPVRHPMRLHPGAGVWEIFVPGLGANERYKFAIINGNGESLPWHADPYARQAELRPANASMVSELGVDQCLSSSRNQLINDVRQPVSIYEVHPASWRRLPDQQTRFPDWDELTRHLIPYVCSMGFTHLELLPVMEHPFDGSWGYQPTGLYAPTARYGSPAGFRRFVSACHAAGIGVILDWVPGHFPSDDYGLARFDGSALYEHEDPREGFHPDWQTLIYNFGRHEVLSFLAGNARYWVEEFDVDGLRVDAVASMLYRDYSRQHDQWIPNRDGGRENYEAVHLLRRVNESLGYTHPEVATIAEESTSWPGVSHPTSGGGLGFHYKWNMGWMNDTLAFMRRDPLYRGHHLNELTFGLHYAFSENFVLPLSHDEVVHGKGSLLARMPGDRWQQFANLRLYFSFMFAHPGKKLLFMGGEFGQQTEWNHEAELDWSALTRADHAGVQTLVRDLNMLYRRSPALHFNDCHAEGFEWVIADDDDNAVIAFFRRGSGPEQTILAVFNFTPVVRHHYRIGVPVSGRWPEIFNSDAANYGGSNIGNQGSVVTESVGSHAQKQSLSLTLPPLAAVFLAYPG